MKKQNKNKKPVNKKLKRKSAGTNKGTSGMQIEAVSLFAVNHILNSRG